jgi:3-oxoacyl-[acyl-carrier-protein] synthase-1
MSGAAQAAYAVIMAERGFTAGTRNFEAPDEGTAGIPVLDHAVDVPPRVMLCNAAGFGGSNACLLLRF